MKVVIYSILSLLQALNIIKTAHVLNPTTQSSPDIDDNLTVDFGYAKYQGVRNETSLNVKFLGIRYAKSPTGKIYFLLRLLLSKRLHLGPLRWKAPQIPDAVTSLQLADSQPSQCPQAVSGTATNSPFRNTSSSIQKRDELPAEDEDCLFLK
jgi:carboxylesterase 2